MAPPDLSASYAVALSFKEHACSQQGSDAAIHCYILTANRFFASLVFDTHFAWVPTSPEELDHFITQVNPIMPLVPPDLSAMYVAAGQCNKF